MLDKEAIRGLFSAIRQMESLLYSNLTPHIDKIEQLIWEDKKLEAIKELRELTGLKPHEAKAEVEYFEANGEWPFLFFE